MKTKLVLWGKKVTENEEEQKSLVALELKPEENKVHTWIFDGEVASEEFEKQLQEQWTKGEAVSFPEGVEATVAELSATQELLPEGMTAEKEELLKRTQTEWLFVVLSTKLYQNYLGEISELQERIEVLETYSKELWGEMKEFWSKVQTQIREKNLFQAHIETLKDRTNELFSILKGLRAKEDAAFEEKAKGFYDGLVERIAAVEAAIKEANPSLNNLFETLKKIQSDFHDAKLTRAMRSELWERIDGAFKEVKNRRSAGQGENRLNRRIEGLKGAIRKMEDSIARDQRELDFKNKKLNNGKGSQLEAQLYELGAKMIRERIASKNTKLEDMYNTLDNLEKRLVKQQERAKKEAEEAKAKAEAEAAAKAAAAEETVEDATEEVVAEPEVPVNEAPIEENTTAEAEQEAVVVEEEPKVEETEAETTEEVADTEEDKKEGE